MLSVTHKRRQEEIDNRAHYVRNAHMAEFSETLKEAMQAEGHTLLDIGRAAGLSHTTVARWLKGSLPDNPSSLAAAAQAFGADWPLLLVRAYLLDLCPPDFHRLIIGETTLANARSGGGRLPPLAAALDAIRLACGRNEDLRRIVLDLGRLAEGL
jgi:transcriptional regulator with XRE-family HTH domain